MWGESSNNCENNCQCSGLITDNFKINSGNNATKHRREEAISTNYRTKMNPQSLNFNIAQSPLKSPVPTPAKRRVLGEIQNSIFSPNSSFSEPRKSPLIDRVTPIIERKMSPLINRDSLSPLTTRSERTFLKRSTTKISRIFEERSKFKMSNKENESTFISETFVKLHVEEETRDSAFGDSLQFPLTKKTTVTNWSTTKLDFTDILQPKSSEMEKNETIKESLVPEKDIDIEDDLETLHDLEEEFESDNFDQCTKYEIISTDSPDIISRGRTSSRKINSKNFVFGAPLSESEPSTSFNRPQNAIRMLNFEDTSFEFTSPPARRPSMGNLSVKKSLKFSDTPTKTKLAETPTKNPLRHEKSDSSIGSMSSPASVKFKIYPSESTTSMESGFISEFEEPFLELEDQSNSPKLANFENLLSGEIKQNIGIHKDFRRPNLHRSLSFNPHNSKAKVSLFSIQESPKKTQKRSEPIDATEDVANKRRKSNCSSPAIERCRPVLQRAFSENNASIMSALARSAMDPDLIGDFSLPFALPLTSGDHSDLKSISCETLASLIKGDFEGSISDFQVIDCRYPYEFEGGHIIGAVNYHTPTQILTLMNKPLQPQQLEAKRNILVFHCEFSLERGPKLSRFLRSSDRAKNKENYPSLHFPEIYLLHEGYRAFYQKYPHLCTPEGYTAMLDPRHKHLLRRHRSVDLPSSSVHNRKNRFLL